MSDQPTEKQDITYDELTGRQRELVYDLQTSVRGAVVEGPLEGAYPLAQALNEAISGMMALSETDFIERGFLEQAINDAVDRRIEEAEPDVSGPAINEEGDELEEPELEDLPPPFEAPDA